MGQSNEHKKLIIPYFISLGFVAVSINSIAKGVDNHETWRIVIASIGGSFFLVAAAVIAVRLIRSIRQPRSGSGPQPGKRSV